MSAPVMGKGFSITAFNGLLDAFLNELVSILGEKEPAICDTYTAFKIMANDPNLNNRRRPLELFMTKVHPYSNIIQAHDEVFITQHCSQIPFLKSMHIEKHWKDFDNDQKAAMWQFLDMLIMIGSTIMAIPAPMMSMVETMAGQLMESGAFQDIANQNSGAFQNSDIKKMLQGKFPPQ